MLKALSCPLDEDLAPLAQFLRSRGVVHRIAEERGEQVIWVVDEASAQIVRESAKLQHSQECHHIGEAH